MAKRDELIVGLDIGTTKIACIAGEVTEDGVDIIAIGTAHLYYLFYSISYVHTAKSFKLLLYISLAFL